MMTKYDFYNQSLEKKLQQKNYQQMKSVLPDVLTTGEVKKPLINFISQDFLNISEHPFVKKNAIKYVLKWGAGSSPSQLISNHLSCQINLEESFAKLYGKESCQFLQPNQQLHSLILGTLLQKNSIVFIDENINSNLLKAIPSYCKIYRFEHNQPHHLEKQLIDHADELGPKWIILESLYTNEGDLVRLKEMLDLSQAFNCFTYLDETNTFSVIGHHGLGLGALKKEVDCIVGFFQRGSGSHAAFFISKTILKNYLIEFNPDLSPHHLLPPATLGAIEAYLQLIPDMHSERQKIMHQSRSLRSKLTEMGFSIKKSSSHIILINFSEEENFQSFVNHLIDENILVFIHKPSLTIRLCITTCHQKEIINDFILRIKNWQKPLIYSKL